MPASYSSGVIFPCAFISWSTTSRRVCDFSGFRMGSHLVGLCVTPARVAACR